MTVSYLLRHTCIHLLLFLSFLFFLVPLFKIQAKVNGNQMLLSLVLNLQATQCTAKQKQIVLCLVLVLLTDRGCKQYNVQVYWNGRIENNFFMLKYECWYRDLCYGRHQDCRVRKINTKKRKVWRFLSYSVVSHAGKQTGLFKHSLLNIMDWIFI